MKKFHIENLQNIFKELTDYEKIVLSVLPVGKENAQYKKYFIDLLGIKEREFRDIIHSLRIKGIPICSNTTKGYWVCKNSDELEEFILFLESYCINIEEVLYSMYQLQNNI